MMMRAIIFTGLIFCVLLGLMASPPKEASKSDLKPLLGEVRNLVEKHYPKGKVTLKDQTIHFEFNTRKYMIHEPLLTGEWQDAHEEVGPQKGGIVGDVELRSGNYGGQAFAPQTFDKWYFKVQFLTPYSKKLDQHLSVQLKFPSDAPKKFLEEFERLINGFEVHLQKGE